MTDWNIKSPLLMDMQILSCLSDFGGIATYLVKSEMSGKKYIFKNISIPESQTHVEGLKLSGAIKTAGEAQTYYAQVAFSYKKELERLKELSESGSIDCFPTWNIQPKEDAIGYDIQVLGNYNQTLTEYLANTAMTHAKAVNLALDLCRSLAVLRSAGLVHCNVKPNNIFLDSQGRFILGGLGTYRVDELRYAAVPERMLGKYAAPELFDVMKYPNNTVDLYSLGLILYSIYNGGHNPFEDEQTSAKGASEKRISGAHLPAPIFADYEMTAILLKACEYDPELRYQTPDAMLADLQDYVQRNVIEETLIVPPIIADEDLLLSQEAIDEEMLPMHFAKAEELEEDFVHHFAPDASVLNESIEAVQRDQQSQNAVEIASDNAVVDEIINSVKSDKPAVAQEPASDEGSPTAPPASPEPANKKKKLTLWLWIGSGIIVLAALIIGLYFLLVPSVRGYSIVSADTSSLVISLDTVYDADDFTATCTDSFGNTIKGTLKNGQFAFAGLYPGTQYTIRLKASNGFDVRGLDSFTASTALATKILDFKVKPITETQIELSFRVEGKDQTAWTMVYDSPESEPQTLVFSEHSVMIKDLVPNTVYTFQLQNADGVTLTGQTQVQHDTTIHISIESITARYTESAVILSWSYAGRSPDSWTVQYSDTDGTMHVQTTKLPEITLEGLKPETNYTVEIFCTGMSEAAITNVFRDILSVENFTASSENNGNVLVTWQCPESADNSWILQAVLPADGSIVRTVEVQGQRAVITGLIPNTTYNISMRSKDGSAVDGSLSTAVTTAATPNFSSFGLTASYVGLFKHPGMAELTVNDLVEFASEYSYGESIAFAMEHISNIDKNTSNCVVTYALRNANGEIVMQKTFEAPWNELWVSKTLVGGFTNVRQPAGTYTLEIYFNNCYSTRKTVTIR